MEIVALNYSGFPTNPGDMDLLFPLYSEYGNIYCAGGSGNKNIYQLKDGHRRMLGKRCALAVVSYWLR